MISHALCHAHTYPAATQKGVADLCLCQLATMYVQMYVQMHVQTCIKIFSPCSCRYIHITNKVVCTSSKHDNQDDNCTGQFFTHQNFPNSDSSKFSTVKILHHTVHGSNANIYCVSGETTSANFYEDWDLMHKQISLLKCTV